MIKEKNGYDFYGAEKQVKEQWLNNQYFEKLVKKNEKGERFRFLDGPITANNAMGIHHAFGRTLKDITIKYNSMIGKSCHFQNGFDAQGLWVEVEVEKQLGFKGKQDIVEYGMDKFTTACLERVDTYAGVISEQSKDLGQWMDWNNSYYTNSNENILGIWHFLKKCDEKGWIAKKHRVMSWCPRCGTSLSEHEMSGNYKNVTCQSAFVKLALLESDVDLLIWTTTPWTLTSNAAAAVHPDLDYAYIKVKSSPRLLICCVGAMKRVVKNDLLEVVEVVKGSELLNLEYKSIFSEFSVQDFVHKIIPWDEISSDEGTGLVHIAPGCGEADFDLGVRYDVPAICPINEAGIIVEGFGIFTGQSTVDVEADIFNTLREGDSLYSILEYNHKYAHCWRCKTDIVYKLVDEWYIRCEEIRPLMLEAVETVEWQPSYGKKRMIDWLNNMSDWNISRMRFYGLPLPFYVCQECGKTHVIGSKEELVQKSNSQMPIDITQLHRPWIDEIKIKCDCGTEVSRVTEVGDCWLDAGIVPFVTKGYFTDRDFFNQNFPSDVVIEMVEQIRLWFYSMLFMSVTLEGCAPYKKVISYGSVIREDGEKFSKSAGKDKNILLDEVIESKGADTIRYLYAGASSINDLRFGYSLCDESKRKILAFWNTYTFFDIYATIDQPKINTKVISTQELEPSDQWVITLVNEFILSSKTNYEKQMYSPILKDFEQLIDDINNWYIRINRKRFWKGEQKSKETGYLVLYSVIKSICKTMAPIIPFMTDFIWHDMVKKYEQSETESVHLSDYPDTIGIVSKNNIVQLTNNAREIISIAQKIRNDNNIMIKQPLSQLILLDDGKLTEAVAVFYEVIIAETNVKEVLCVDNMNNYMETKLSVNFATSGKVLKNDVNMFKNYLEEINLDESNKIIDKLTCEGQLIISGIDKPITKELFVFDSIPKHNYAINVSNSKTVLLNTKITETLHNEYLVRTLIRKLQMLRKEMNLNIESHIHLNIEIKDNQLKKILMEAEDTIKTELLIDCMTYDVFKSDKMTPENRISDVVELHIDNYLIKLIIKLN